MPISPSAVRPSYAQGFADSAATSAYPELWRGLGLIASPALGHTGLRLYDAVKGLEGTFDSTMDIADWVRVFGESGVELDGTDDLISFPNGASGITSQPVSIEAWVYWSSVAGGGDRSIMGLTSTSGGFTGWQLQRRGGTLLDFQLTTGVRSTYSGSLSAGQLYHIVGVSASPTSHILYVDGVPQTENTTSTTPSIGTGHHQIGAWVDNSVEYNHEAVTVLKAAWYGRALTPSEVLFLSRDPLAPFRRRRRTVGYVAAAPPAGTNYNQSLSRIEHGDVRSLHAIEAGVA